MKTVIDSKTANKIDFKEIIKFKDLLWNLSIRDVLIRYKQTVIGLMWAILRPLINIVIFGFLSQFIEHSPNVAERFLNVSAGIIIWGLISTSISDSSNSILNNASILTKVYFPKIIIPLSSLTVCLIDFFISFVILFIIRVIVIGMPGIEFILFPVFVLYALLFSISIGLYFSALNVKYRDVKFIIPFLIQIGFYVCPVFLSTQFYVSKLPEALQTIFLSNPIVTIVDGFKYCFMGTPMQIPMLNMLIGFLFTLATLTFSLKYFVKFEKSFADHI